MALPISCIISGSHIILNASPMTLSSTPNGSVGSSSLPRRKPGTVTMQLTRLWLWIGRNSNVFTFRVRRCMPRAPSVAPLSVPVVVITVAPPTPPKMSELPATLPIPMVASADPIPAPISGASNPADRPITSPPPTVARPIMASRLLRRARSCFEKICRSSSVCTSSSICSVSVMRFSNLVTSIDVSPSASATRSSRTRERAS